MCGDPRDPEIVATTAVGDIMGVCNRQRAAVLGFEGRESIDGWEESEANARLIASLPTLLAERDALKAALEASRADAARLADALDEASCCRVLLSNHALAGSDWFPARQEASAQKTYAALSAHRALTGEVK